MARRRYVRDNRGRFASTGATARGGRLKTASGKKRETQTMKASGGGVAGTIGKPKGLKPGTIKPKPKASSKPRRTRSRSVGKISEAKAGRIVERIDAQRGRRALAGRRNANFIRTMERRSEFILKPAAAARKKGKPISVNESVQKAVLNASKRAKRRRR